MRRPVIILLAALTIMSCTLGQVVSAPPPAPLPANTDTPTPLPTQPEAATPQPTQTPTQIPTFTPEPSLTPTSTPEGYYRHAEAGFSVMLSNDWQKEDETEEGAAFSNDHSGLYLAIHGKLALEPSGLEGQVKDFLDANQKEFSGTPDVTYDKVTLGDGRTADQATIVVKNTNGVFVAVRIILTWEAQRNYVILIMGSKIAVQSDRYAIKRILSSVLFHTPQVFGLDRSKTLVTLGGADPTASDLDPGVTASGAQGYVGLLYSGLVRLSPDLQVEPDLAENWMVSDTGRVYTFTLRSGLTFQSGRALTAKDVKYSLERAADPKTGSLTARIYLGDIQGMPDRLDGKADEIAGVKVIDERRIQITLDAAKPYFLEKLTYPTSFVVNEDDINENPHGWMFKPQGSGPFELERYENGNLLIFHRFDGFYSPARVESIAYLLSRKGPRLGYFQTDQVDVTTLGVSDALQVLNPEHPLHDQLHSISNLCTSLILFDNQAPPMDDPQVRRAFSLAVDKDRLIGLVSNHLDTRADTILPPGMPGFLAAGTNAAFDPVAARAALNASKYAGNLPTIVISSSGYNGTDDVFMNALVDMWRANLGVEVEVEYLDGAHYTREVHENHGQLVRFGWCADYPDPENFLDLLFHSGSDMNPAGYSNSQVDALLEEARTEVDTTRRLTLYQQIEKLLLDDYAAIPLWHDVTYLMEKPRVQGLILTPLGARDWNLISLNPPDIVR